MTKLAIVYHSGYGHTKKQAEAVQSGAVGVAGVSVALIAISAEGDLPEGGWETLAAANAIICSMGCCGSAAA